MAKEVKYPELDNESFSSKLTSLAFSTRRTLIILAHLLAFSASLFLSFLLAKNMTFGDWITTEYPILLLVFICIKFIIFGLFKQYRGWWRYVSVTDLTAILRASLVSTLILFVLWFAVFLQMDQIRQTFSKVARVEQSIFVFDLFATVMILAGIRMMIRLYHEEFRTEEAGHLKRILILGAGNAGEALLREIHRMSVTRYDVIGFIDDDPAKRGTSIHGITVLGNVGQLSDICKKRNIEEIAIAIPSASQKQIRNIIQVCQGSKIKFTTVPSITDIASGKLRVSQIREIDINDLLGREAVELDMGAIEKFSKDKTILVTGAGGSIGSEMCRQLCKFSPALLLLVEQAENPLFHIDNELKKDYPAIKTKAIICDITDSIRVNDIFSKYKPEVIIHAAAHKHVPLMETNPGESIKNNIVGTKTIADASCKHNSTNFVMISTDKAVNPTSLMGTSKRIAEMYIQNLNTTSQTDFITVRFGNVLGSNGSVVPLFKKQIAIGGPVTVTDPEMQRYFMTIPEASQLVLQAASMGKGGEIFVLDMGEPVKIVDLAKDLITLSGLVPDEDIEIIFSGLRPGEKLFEELSIKGENMQPTCHPKIGVWNNIPSDRDKLYANITQLVEIAHSQNHAEIVAKIKTIVPEYIGKPLKQ